ncbi:MAG: leucine--tRNA ligase [Microgenomates group bacterium]
MEDKKTYNPSEFESKMVELWEKERVYSTEKSSKASADKEKAYCLSMFPYPSGAGLHVGHVRIYTGTDVIARYFKMMGKEVLHPMGWDAFGLPAENAAIKAQKNPIDMVPGNIANFKRQMNMLGLSYDWGKELATTDPAYYKWTQWLFIQFFKMGLLYKRNTPIHWCPKCKTGLAEEEVLANGTHERCGSEISKKELPQWIFRITTYAEQLLEDLKLLDWPKGILEMQRNWIGKKEGIIIKHTVSELDLSIETFSAYPAWLFADTFIVVAPEHPVIKKLVEGTKFEKDVNDFIEESKKITSQQRTEDKFEKKGVFTGRYADDPFNKGRKMPIWLANFAMMDFGTGIIRCSAHDVRDYEFATKYQIHLEEVVERTDPKMPINAHDNAGILKNSGPFTGKTISTELINEIKNWIVEQKIGRKETTYHLRDWIFSRQRYWGEPIPMVYCERCALEGVIDGEKIDPSMAGWFAIKESELPLELPYTAAYEPTDTGESPLSKMKDFVTTTCPHCGGNAKRETDTMPNWAGSCWYFIHFAQNEKTKVKYQSLKEEWMDTMTHSSFAPVDWYLGGAEHAVLHLLYARFWVKALRDIGLLNYPEPFLRLRNVGMVLAEDHRKMSKSWGNTINPDDVVAQYGADTLRLYEMFMAPFNMEIAWSMKALQGAHRFIKRVFNLYETQKSSFGGQKSNLELVNKLNKTIQKVGDDIAQTKFNTAIAAMMEFLNAFEAQPELSASEAKKFIQILAPFAPFTTEQIWREIFNEKSSVHLSSWPTQTEVDIKETSVEVPVQVNGKFRGTVVVPVAATKEEIEQVALKSEGIAKYITGTTYKLIYVKGRICNFVLS